MSRSNCLDGYGVALRRAKTLGSLQDVRPAGESALCEARRSNARSGRASGVQRLGHRAENGFQGSRLRTRDTERLGCRIGIEFKKLCRSRSGTKAADGARCMPAALVRRTAGVADDQAFGVDAGRKRPDHVAPG